MISYILTILVIVLFFITLSGSSSKKKASFKIMLGLTVIFTVFLLFNPESLNSVANAVGVGRGADLLFYLYIVISAFLIARLYLIQKEMDEKITKMARVISILKHDRESTKNGKRQ